MKPNSKIAVIGAMDCEIEKIKELLSDIAECDFGGIVEIGGILPSLPLPLGASPFPVSATGSGKGLSNPNEGTRK